MKILLAVFCVYLLGFVATGCVTEPEHDFAQVRIYNASRIDTLGVMSENGTRQLLPGDSLDITYAVGGLHEISITGPRATTTHYTHIVSLSQREYIRYADR